MTEDSAIRIDFDSAEFVHVTHTMEFFLRPTPRNLSHRILGTRPRRSELEFSTKLDYRVTFLRYHRLPTLGIPVSPRHLCLLDTGPPRSGPPRSLTFPPWG